MNYFEEFSGKIKNCKTYFSRCSCCQHRKVRIFMLPGEFENSNKHKNHIVVTDENYFGGKTGTCAKLCDEKDFKPFECKSYPYDPFFDKKGNLILKKSESCPLNKIELKDHK
ncbi:MAG: hypothetical protein ABIC82_06045 [bacterium]